jgi:hypothetical protein
MGDQSAPQPSPPARRGLRRRDFLALSSLAAVTPLLEPFAAAGELLANATSPSSKPLSIGYLEGSQFLSGLSRLAASLPRATVIRQGDTLTSGLQVVPASSLPSGDPSLVGGAVRLAVRGFYGPTGSGLPPAIDLDVYVPALALAAGDGALFHAWSYRGAPAENLSAPLSFPVWPDWTSNLALGLRVVPASGATRNFHSTFTLAAQAGQPRLQTGVYLLGLTADAWSTPVTLPADPSSLPARLVSIVFTVAPEGLRSAS